jgi:hypothetical protein
MDSFDLLKDERERKRGGEGGDARIPSTEVGSLEITFHDSNADTDTVVNEALQELTADPIARQLVSEACCGIVKGVAAANPREALETLRTRLVERLGDDPTLVPLVDAVKKAVAALQHERDEARQQLLAASQQIEDLERRNRNLLRRQF